MSSARENFDVAVIGGGPAGAAAAITLARAHRRVLLVEATASVPFKVGESLPPAALPLLRDLGAHSRLAAASHSACPGTVAVWGGAEPMERDFIREPHGSGWHLDRPRFDADLRATASAAGAEVRSESILSSWNRSAADGRWQLRFSQRDTTTDVSATWIVDATGRRALIANREGATVRHDDALTAFCVLTSAASGADGRTFIEATADGWWYSALLPAGRRMLAFFTDADLPAARAVASAAGFSRGFAATRHIHATVGALPPAAIDRVRRIPAGSMSRVAFAGDGWLAVGDATLAFDPLSSQGIFHALYTGLRGAEATVAALAGDKGALTAWHDRLSAILAAYRRHLAQCYVGETRWPAAPFWRRRHAMSGAATQPAAVLAETF